MKLLIAATCVAVLMFVGYFFFGEIQRSSRPMAETNETAGVSQYRIETMTDDHVLDKISGVNFNPYERRFNPEIFDALPHETVSGELQRLRISAARDAAKFVACNRVISSHYSNATTRMNLAVDVECSGNLRITYTRSGPSTPLARF